MNTSSKWKLYDTKESIHLVANTDKYCYELGVILILPSLQHTRVQFISYVFCRPDDIFENGKQYRDISRGTSNVELDRYDKLLHAFEILFDLQNR